MIPVKSALKQEYISKQDKQTRSRNNKSSNPPLFRMCENDLLTDMNLVYTRFRMCYFFSSLFHVNLIYPLWLNICEDFVCCETKQ